MPNITVSLPDEEYFWLRKQPNKSRAVAEAVRMARIAAPEVKAKPKRPNKGGRSEGK